MKGTEWRTIVGDRVSGESGAWGTIVVVFAFGYVAVDWDDGTKSVVIMRRTVRGGMSPRNVLLRDADGQDLRDAIVRAADRYRESLLPVGG